MAVRKPWDDHSDRWKRQAAREGLDARRWNAWTRLSAKSRATTDPREYARGKSVSQQHTDRQRAGAVAAIMSVKAGNAREITVRRGVQSMSSRELNKILGMPSGQLDEYVTRKARQPLPAGQVRNPYWYR